MRSRIVVTKWRSDLDWRDEFGSERKPSQRDNCEVSLWPIDRVFDVHETRNAFFAQLQQLDLGCRTFAASFIVYI